MLKIILYIILASNFLYCYKSYAKDFMLPGVWTRTDFSIINGTWKADGSQIGPYCVPNNNQPPSNKQMLTTLEGLLSNGDGQLVGVCKSKKYFVNKNKRTIIANCTQTASYTSIKIFKMSGLFLKVIKVNDRFIVVHTGSPKKLKSGHENFYSWNYKIVYKYHGQNCHNLNRIKPLNSHESTYFFIGLPNGTYLN